MDIHIKNSNHFLKTLTIIETHSLQIQYSIILYTVCLPNFISWLSNYYLVNRIHYSYKEKCLCQLFLYFTAAVPQRRRRIFERFATATVIGLSPKITDTYIDSTMRCTWSYVKGVRNKNIFFPLKTLRHMINNVRVKITWLVVTHIFYLIRSILLIYTNRFTTKYGP